MIIKSNHKYQGIFNMFLVQQFLIHSCKIRWRQTEDTTVLFGFCWLVVKTSAISFCFCFYASIWRCTEMHKRGRDYHLSFKQENVDKPQVYLHYTTQVCKARKHFDKLSQFHIEKNNSCSIIQLKHTKTRPVSPQSYSLIITKC